MYCEFFDLSDYPFSPRVDALNFYRSTTVDQALATLRHGMLSGDRLLVFNGAAGAGKTALLNYLRAGLASSVRSEYVLGSDDSDTEFLQAIAHAYGLPVADTRAQLFNDITHEWQRLSSRGERLLLIVDNAHGLTIPSLRVVNRLVSGQANGAYSVTVLLSGRNDLPKQLVREFGSLRDQQFRMIASLQPLNVTDTEHYISARIAHVGGEATAIFSASVMALVHTYSNGLPQRINSLCDIALLNAYAQGDNKVKRAHLESALRKLGWAVRRDSASTQAHASARIVSTDTNGHSVSYDLSGQALRIGRAEDCDIRIDQQGVADYQAAVVPISDSSYLLENHNTDNSVLVNASAVKRVPLKSGDVVSIGNAELRYETLSAEQRPSAQSS